MSTCCWCTPGGTSTVDVLKCYASSTGSSEFQTADEDLCYCLECVAEYHRARDEVPFLHEVIAVKSNQEIVSVVVKHIQENGAV